MHPSARRLGPPQLAALVVVSLTLRPCPAAAEEAVVLTPPAAGPADRGFEEPAGRFGAGHRGLDFALPVGTPVRAAADGTVTFAGVVAGSRFVTLSHAGGGPGPFETTYSYLSHTDVRPGQRVRAGDVIGASGAGHPGRNRPALHFGVRRDGRHVDPGPMLGLAPSDVSALVALGPLPDPAALRPQGSRPLRPSRLAPSRGPPGWSRLPSLAHGGPRLPAELRSTATIWGLGRGFVRQIRCGRPAGGRRIPTPPSARLRGGAQVPPPNDNVVIAVAGIGSSTWRRADGSMGSDAAMYRLDLRTLGYPPDRVFHFSYRGPGQGSSGGAGTPYRFHEPYRKEDTLRPIAASAALLGRLVEKVHAAGGGRHIDIVAHSQGGVVAQFYLGRIYDPGRPAGPVVDHLVTIASPHRGADLAGLEDRLDGVLNGRTALRGIDWIAGALGAPPPGSPAARDLAVGSPVLDELARDWKGTVATTTIAAGVDLVVPPQRTHLPGAARYTVDLPNAWSSVWAHTAIVTAEQTRQIAYGALSGRPLPCTAMRDALADHVAGPLISTAERGLLEVLARVAAGPGGRAVGR